MKTLGLLGGMSWESTRIYYQLINEGVRERLGGLHSAELLLDSMDFAPLAERQAQGRWDLAGADLARRARRLEAAGAEALVLCTNTMHKLADLIAEAVSIPLIHIADPTGAALRAAGHRRVALLATRFTMEQDFYRAHLEREHGLEVLVPEAEERGEVHRIVYEELCRGRIEPGSRQAYLAIAEGLRQRGAEALILGCTEIGLLLKPGDTELPLFDTCALHAAAAVEFALG
ncbi:MAG: aspartate/glutamate racemase family protein [Gammaproteobacteria bacterium]|nr:aspartate/glutamate racemase family protein [Gammaproteobacteria bacterium]